MHTEEISCPKTQTLTQRRHGKRLSYKDIRTALNLREMGKTQPEIAQILGCHDSSISRALHDLTDDTTELAIARAKGSADRRARRLIAWGKKRDKVGLDANKHLDSIAGLGDKVNQVNNIAVVLGVTLSAPQEAAIEAKVLENSHSASPKT